MATEVMKEVVLLGCRAFCRSTRSQLSASEGGANRGGQGVVPSLQLQDRVAHLAKSPRRVSSVITASFAENR